MRPEEFEFLFVHAQGLAELGLQMRVAALADRHSSTPALADPQSLAGREAAALALLAAMDPEQMDFSLLDGWAAADPLRVAGQEAATDSIRSEAAAEAAAESGSGSRTEAEAEQQRQAALGEDADLAGYLELSYAARDQVRARIAHCWRHCDLAQLDQGLRQLPRHWPPLTAALSGDGLARWLACYVEGNDALSAIVTEIRRVDLREG